LYKSIDWGAVVLRRTNWATRLLLLSTLLLATFNTIFLRNILDLSTGAQLSKNYSLYFWLAISAAFILAAVSLWRARPKKAPALTLAAPSAIKGLLAFDMADEEVFARLQRHNELLECAQAITGQNFRFGILSADSGNGKTSFLQAGLLPTLQKRGHHCVYLKFAELDPVISIKQALSGRLSPGTPSDATISELLRSPMRSEDKGRGAARPVARSVRAVLRPSKAQERS
jgi:hypothetical protein